MLVPSLVLTPVVAADFQVGAGMEALAYATEGEANAGVGHVEIDGLLTLGSVEVRADLDIGPPAWGGADRIGAFEKTITPEWAAVILGVRSWRLAAGVQPLPTGREQVDPWRNPSVVYSQAFSTLYAGHLLGLRGQWDRQLLSVQAWGGVGDPWDAPAFGAGVLYGEHARAGLAVTAFPVDRRVAAHAHGILPIAGVTTLSAELLYSSGAMGAVGTVEFLPEALIVPMLRAEWNSAGKPWAVEAGAQITPLDNVRFTLTGRAQAEQIWGFVALSLVDEQARDPWRL